MKMERGYLDKITPEKANEYLIKNAHNQRKIKAKHVDFLANEMKNGHWVFNGDPIRFDANNNLIDGQHRLHAIVKSGITQELFVITGLEQNAMFSIDSGRVVRGADDYLHIAGEKYTSTLGSSIVFCLLYEKGRLFQAHRVSQYEIIEYLAKNPDIRTSCESIQTKWVKRLMTPSLAAGFHYLFSKIDKEKADDFFDIIERGIYSQISNAPNVLRDSLMEKKITNRNANMILSKKYVVAITIKAWNAYIKGKMIKGLHYSAIKEKIFPAISSQINF
jgi:hypothetical protein